MPELTNSTDLTKKSNNDPSKNNIEDVNKSSTLTRKKLGEILVEKGIITTLTVERVLPLCSNAKKRLGTVLEEIGLIASEELAQALAIQYGCKIISDFAKYHYSPEVLQLIPMETAVEHLIFPLKVKNNVLALAVYDPTNDTFIKNIAANLNMRIVPFIATKIDINRAIVKYYLDKEMSENKATTILIVDDDRLTLTALQNMLDKDGYNVVTASDGMEAYKAIVTYKPRLVITDKVMPKFNGYDLLYSIKNLPGFDRIPAILISGTNNPDEEDIAYEKGFFDFIRKPVSESALRTKVKRALKSHRHLIALHPEDD